MEPKQERYGDILIHTSEVRKDGNMTTSGIFGVQWGVYPVTAG